MKTIKTLSQEYEDWLFTNLWLGKGPGSDASLTSITEEMEPVVGVAANELKKMLTDNIEKPVCDFLLSIGLQPYIYPQEATEKQWRSVKNKIKSYTFSQFLFHFRDASTTKMRLYEQGLAKKYEHPGIYSISIGDKLVYIGKSRDMLTRVAQHIDAIGTDPSNKYKVLDKAREEGYRINFDVMKYCEQDDDELGEAEAELINQHMPPLNYQIPTIGDYKHYTVNKKAKYITLAEILDPSAQTFYF